MAAKELALDQKISLAEDSEVLSDEQIERLLQEAETRLRNASELVTQARDISQDEDIIGLETAGRRKQYFH